MSTLLFIIFIAIHDNYRGPGPKPSGRPTFLAKTTVLKLEQALKEGFSVEIACNVVQAIEKGGLKADQWWLELCNETVLDVIYINEIYELINNKDHSQLML